MFSIRTSLACTTLGLSSLVFAPTLRPGTGANAERSPEVQRFELTAKRFAFEPARLEVTEGQTVRIVIRSADGAHGIGIKQFKVKRDVPKSGEPVTLEFVASQAGTFPIACSEYCGKGHKTMTAELVVRPKTQ